MNKFTAIFGVFGAAISTLFGGWDVGLKVLLIFMAVDYITGIATGIFGKSTKSETGALQSKAGWKGLCRKGLTLLMVLVATQLDAVIGSNFIRDTVVIGFVTNEVISIVENAGLLGVPLPTVLIKAIDILKNKSESD